MSSLATATSAVLPTTFGRALRSVVAFAKAMIGRREVTQLLGLDDRMLKDIGLSRADVAGALASPWAHDPSILLRLRSVERRALQRARTDAVGRVNRVRVTA